MPPAPAAPPRAPPSLRLLPRRASPSPLLPATLDLQLPYSASWNLRFPRAEGAGGSHGETEAIRRPSFVVLGCWRS